MPVSARLRSTIPKLPFQSQLAQAMPCSEKTVVMSRNQARRTGSGVELRQPNSPQ
jgi:hypothetical protein